MPPIRFGMKYTVLKRFVPFMLRVSSSATVSANRFITSVDTTVKRTVSQNDCENSGSATAFT